MVDREKLLSTYIFEEKDLQALELGIPCTVNTKQDYNPVWAELHPVPEGHFTVKTAWGDVLTGNSDDVEHLFGDFLVAANDHKAPSDTDRWIVNGEVFFNTYRRCYDY